MIRTLRAISPYLAYIPIIVFIAYVAGYISLSSFYEMSQIPESPKLDVQTIKVGVIFCLIILPILYFAFDVCKTDSLDIESLIRSSYSTFIYSYIVTYILEPRFQKTDFLIILVILYIIYITQVEIRSEIQKWLIIVSLFLPLIIVHILEDYIPEIRPRYQPFIFLIKIFSSMIFISIIRYISEQAKYLVYIGIVGIIISFMVKFGADIYRNIPSYLGGERQRLATIYFKPDFLKESYCAPIYNTIINGSADLPILYETEENIYVYANEEAACIPKSTILYSSRKYSPTPFINPFYLRSMSKLDTVNNISKYLDFIIHPDKLIKMENKK